MAEAEYFEYTPAEDKRLDSLMDYLSPIEAREQIMRERQDILGFQAVTAAMRGGEESVPAWQTQPSAQLEAKKPRHYSRRGGRSYGEQSDSETDPYWNGTAPSEAYVPTAEDGAAFEAVVQDSRQAVIDSLVRRGGFSPVEASAKVKARREVNRR